MKTLGVIGGMGPLSTCEFYRRLIERTPAKRDQEHIHVIVDSYPQIPDRTDYLLGHGESPVPHLVASARRLQNAGAEVLCVPCNTAHAFFDIIESSVNIPVLNMVVSTVERVAEITDRAVILATDGTIAGGVYHVAARERGLKVETPPSRFQRKLMAAIYAVKAGKVHEGKETVEEIVRFYGSETVLIAACTEVSMVIDERENVVDAMDVLVELVIKTCLP